MMRAVVVLLAIFACANAAVQTRAFARFWSVNASPANQGYVTLDGTTAITASGDLRGFTASTAYTVFVHQYGDVGDGTTATACGTCFNANPVFGFTTDASGNYQFAAVAIGTTGIGLTGGETTSMIGRTLVVHSGSVTTCTGTLISQAVIGIANVSAADTNDAHIATTGPMVAFARMIGSNNFPGIGGEFWISPNTNTNVMAPSGGAATVMIYARLGGGTNPFTIGNKHGMHVHQWGDTSDMPTYLSAGGHFNPAGVAHAGPTTATRHQGDMGNVTIDAQGLAIFSGYYLDLQSLNAAPNNVIGRCVLLHAAPDDGVSQPVGNAGGRWAAGVLGLSSRVAPGTPSSSSTGMGAGFSVAPSAIVAVLLAAISLILVFKH
jgi:Cu/Zn superoxide dismutase